MSALTRFLDELEALPDAQLAGVLPLAVLMFSPDGAVPARLRPAVEAFIHAVGWDDAGDDDARARAVDAWLAKTGVDAAVWRRLLAAFQEDPEQIRDAARALGAGPRVAGALERTAPAPAGTVAAGPMARFSAPALTKKEP